MKIYYVAGLPYSDELYHHGIKGQKWGVRRYQNADGTYTMLGKVRYGAGKAARSTGRVIKKAASKVKEKVVEKYKKANPEKRMNDKELRDYINRINLENSYKQAQESLKSKQFGTKAMRAVGDIIGRAGNKVINRAIDEAVNKMFEKPDKKTDWKEVLNNKGDHSDKEIKEALDRAKNERSLDRTYSDAVASTASTERGRKTVKDMADIKISSATTGKHTSMADAYIRYRTSSTASSSSSTSSSSGSSKKKKKKAAKLSGGATFRAAP